MSQEPTRYRAANPIRIVTAASLFDGHDAAINIMRRILQASGAEIIHLGHNRSVAELVDCAIQEDAQAIAITSYQGGHVEYLSYMVQMLAERGANIRVFAGGGGTILPDEIEALHAAGVARIYSPDDGRSLGLQGMIDHLISHSDFPTIPGTLDPAWITGLRQRDAASIARCITLTENHAEARPALHEALAPLLAESHAPVLGITGTGGAGKSSLVDELVRRFLADFPDKHVAVLSVDPSRRRSGGALLGDRIRMNSARSKRLYMRSLATRQANLSLTPHIRDAIDICRAAGFDLVIVETSGIGQSDTEITGHADVSLYVMTAEYGAATQLEKIDMLDFADLVAINKFDKRGSLDAIRDVRKQVQRNRTRFDLPPEQLPVFGTIASQFADPGTDRLYVAAMRALAERTGAPLIPTLVPDETPSEKVVIIPPERTRYLSEIAESVRGYGRFVEQQGALATRAFQLWGTIHQLRDATPAADAVPGPLSAEAGDLPEVQELLRRLDTTWSKLDHQTRTALSGWPATQALWAADQYRFQVRDRVIEQPLTSLTLSGTSVPKVLLPRSQDWGEITRWVLSENVPGSFPYAAGVFPLKRQGEDPARMFAGEGGPERTNHRFHYVSRGMPAKRLSTAFDSVTLYGEDPDHRPDIFGKVGNSGVSVANLDDAKKLYSGFDLSSPSTSVSMTINGPAPMLLAFFLLAAIDQQCERHIVEHGLEAEVNAKIDAIYAERGQARPRYRGALPEGNDGLGLMLLGVTGDEVLPADAYARIAAQTVKQVRGTVQADILKEDQAQNTCIFSTEFALRMQGDIQEWFVNNQVRNFYSVSISGYHIAEAGANPITQLAFTLANGFTFVEYYLSRGMSVDAFAPNLSFFFSNGMDAEYAVLGRVARRIWAKAMKLRYGADERSQKLKYHIQTSGRSLHAQEIAFNDIRTTLQALYALYDNCNSLHTNAYDEAITTPTEESVRRALAIQLVIAHELGLNKSENTLQGSFIIEDLTQKVEAAVLAEFDRISERGGVLGAMERMYQRSKIQEESLLYETKKHDGTLPIIGVNTFLDPQGSPTVVPPEVIRSGDNEKQSAIADRDAFQHRRPEQAAEALIKLQRAAGARQNTFAALLQAAKLCTLGQMTHALYEVGGEYRRNM